MTGIMRTPTADDAVRIAILRDFARRIRAARGDRRARLCVKYREAREVLAMPGQPVDMIRARCGAYPGDPSRTLEICLWRHRRYSSVVVTYAPWRDGYRLAEAWEYARG